jgi:hypothetical protein
LDALRSVDPRIEVRAASVEVPASLDRAVEGVSVIINCAGPFAITAGPMIEASPPAAIDSSGRSSQIFLVEALARMRSVERRAAARGRDIYAISAPLVVEAAERIVNGSAKSIGVVAVGEAFDAREFLEALAPGHLTVEFEQRSWSPAIASA